MKNEEEILKTYGILIEKRKNSANYKAEKQDKYLENDAKLILFLKENNFEIVRNTVFDVAKIVQENLKLSNK